MMAFKPYPPSAHDVYLEKMASQRRQQDAQIFKDDAMENFELMIVDRPVVEPDGQRTILFARKPDGQTINVVLSGDRSAQSSLEPGMMALYQGAQNKETLPLFVSVEGVEARSDLLGNRDEKGNFSTLFAAKVSFQDGKGNIHTYGRDREPERQIQEPKTQDNVFAFPKKPVSVGMTEDERRKAFQAQEDGEVFGNRKLREIKIHLTNMDVLDKDNVSFKARSDRGPLDVVLTRTRSDEVRNGGKHSMIASHFAIGNEVEATAKGYFRPKNWTDEQGKPRQSWDFVAAKMDCAVKGTTMSIGFDPVVDVQKSNVKTFSPQKRSKDQDER